MVTGTGIQHALGSLPKHGAHNRTPIGPSSPQSIERTARDAPVACTQMRRIRSKAGSNSSSSLITSQETAVLGLAPPCLSELPSRPQPEVVADPARLERAATLGDCGLRTHPCGCVPFRQTLNHLPKTA